MGEILSTTTTTWLFIFGDIGSTGYYVRGAGEQAHSFGDLGSPAKKQKKKIKEKPPFCLILKISSASVGIASQTPLINPKCTYFRITFTSRLTSGKNMTINFCCCSFINLEIVDI